MSGPSSSIRQTFITQGRLQNYADTNYRRIEDSQPGFAFAKDFGSLAAGSSGTATFAVGHFRDPGVSFTAANSSQPDRSLFFMSSYPSLESSLSFFYSDFAEALALSNAFDAKVQSEATASVSAHYAALCAIAARQVYSGLEITVGKATDGSYNTSDVMVFVKEIATSNYVNTGGLPFSVNTAYQPAIVLTFGCTTPHCSSRRDQPRIPLLRLCQPGHDRLVHPARHPVRRDQLPQKHPLGPARHRNSVPHRGRCPSAGRAILPRR
jgi:hypothetical protein